MIKQLETGFYLLFILFLSEILPCSSSRVVLVHNSSNPLKCVGCRGKNAFGSPPDSNDTTTIPVNEPRVPDCKKYHKNKPRPEFILTCNLTMYPDPVCYAYKDGSFSGCDDRTRSAHAHSCEKVDTLEGARIEVCFCDHDLCNGAWSWSDTTKLFKVFMIPVVVLRGTKLLWQQDLM